MVRHFLAYVGTFSWEKRIQYFLCKIQDYHDCFFSIDLQIACPVLRVKDKSLVKLTAVGYPTPVCTNNHTEINCETTVELSKENPSVLLTARNAAGFKEECLRTFGKTFYHFFLFYKYDFLVMFQ